jgi:hypothetical protein
MGNGAEANSASVRIALLEHDQFPWVQGVISELFKEAGYAASIVRLDPRGRNAKNTVDILADTVIDVFVSDISLGRQGEEDGLDHIRAVRHLFPDLLTVGISGTDIEHGRIVAKYPNFHLFINKRDVESEHYRAYVVSEIRSAFRKNTSAFVDWEQSVIPLKMSTPDRAEMERLLRGITFTAHDADRASQVHRIILTPLKKGFSDTVVFRMKAFTRNELQCVNAVLRLSSPDRIEREHRNFASFVKWYLPYSWRVEMLGICQGRKRAGVAYSFAYDARRDFVTLSEWFAEGRRRCKSISGLVGAIFDASRQRWYSGKNVVTEFGGDLSSHYARRLYRSGESKDRVRTTFRKLASLHGLADPNVVSLDDYNYPAPYVFLFQRHSEFRTCICHGDLHGDNLLVTEEGDFCFIDFQQTGRGHVFLDFAALELSIRLEWPGEEFDPYMGVQPAVAATAAEQDRAIDLSGLITLELEIARENAVDIGYSNLVQQIRTLARANFPDEPWENYLFSVAAYSYWVTGFTKDRAASVRARAAATALASIRRIRELES